MAEGKVMITSNSLNVRKGADITFDTLGKLKKGDVVSYYSETNGWLNINYHSNSAYIMKEYTTDYNGGSGGSTKSGSGVDFDVHAAVEYNNNCGYTMDEWKKIQGVVGAKQDGKPGEKTAGSIAQYQKKNGLPVSGKCDEVTLAKMNIQVSSASSTSNPQNGSSISQSESQTSSGNKPEVSNPDPVVESKPETPVSASSSSSSEVIYDENAAVAYNRSCDYTKKEWEKIQGVVGAKQDGDPGKKTARAIRDYQMNHGLPATGKCDEATLAKMGIQVSSASSTSNPQNGPSVSQSESQTSSGNKPEVSNPDPVVESKPETPVSASSSSSSEVIYDEEAAVAYNRSCAYTKKDWEKIQKVVGAKQDGDPGKKTARAIRDYQMNHGLPATGKCDEATLAKMNIQVSSASSNQMSSSSTYYADFENTERAINANLAKSYTADLWRKIHATLGLPERDVPDIETAHAVAGYQKAKKLTPVDGICGKMTLGKMGFQPQYAALPHTSNYKQGAAPWGKTRYSNDPKKNDTYAYHGCGPTAVANVIHDKVDSSVTPATIGDIAMANTQYMGRTSGTLSSFIPFICGYYGLTCVEKRPNNDNLNLLRRPTLAIANIDSHHFVTPYGVDGEHVYVDDPAHNAITKWTRKDFSSHAARFWLIY